MAGRALPAQVVMFPPPLANMLGLQDFKKPASANKTPLKSIHAILRGVFYLS